MLALTRKKNEAIVMSGGIEIKILDIQGDKVKIGITAPKECGIYREEIYAAIKTNNQESVHGGNIDLIQLEELF